MIDYSIFLDLRPISSPLSSPDSYPNDSAIPSCPYSLGSAKGQLILTLALDMAPFSKSTRITWSCLALVLAIKVVFTTLIFCYFVCPVFKQDSYGFEIA